MHAGAAGVEQRGVAGQREHLHQRQRDVERRRHLEDQVARLGEGEQRPLADLLHRPLQLHARVCQLKRLERALDGLKVAARRVLRLGVAQQEAEGANHRVRGRVGLAGKVGGGHPQLGAGLPQQHGVLHGHRHEDLGVGSPLHGGEAARLPPVENDQPSRHTLHQQVARVRVAVEDLAVHGEREGLDQFRHDGPHGLSAGGGALAAQLLDVEAVDELHRQHAPGNQLRQYFGDQHRSCQVRSAQRLPRGCLVGRLETEVELVACEYREVLDDGPQVVEEVRERQGDEHRNQL
mmetsp:Transcript_5575/g.18550  ORF Transcript_5575/g.18550 Transcript_5575/m.18550 type:complete len:292 (+) Transcript_5575:1707-2582(+)